MSIIDPLLFGHRAGTFFTSALSTTGLVDVASAIQSRGWDAVVLDGAAISSKESFIEAVANALDFPETSGRNWDALADSLSDLSWSSAESRVLVWSFPENLVKSDPGAASVAFDILTETVEVWQDKQGHFSVLLATDAAAPAAFVPLP